MTRRSPLHELHADLGARFTTFGGWEMPLQYEGTLSEHDAVRSNVGVFDVSHLGRFVVSGPGATELIDRLLCNDLSRIAPGGTQYTMLLTPQGGIVDDIVVWWLEEQRLLVLPNAANHERVIGVFTDEAGSDVSVDDLQATTALIAVQGPNAPALLEEVLGSVPKRRKVAPPNDDLVAAGTGYTGEAGGELLVPLDRAEDLFTGFVEAGARPCGLGARDTLRLEVGLPLWGQDLDENVTPLEAGFGWAVGWDSEFVGRDALLAQREDGVGKARVGLLMEDRRPPRPGYPLRTGDSSGNVTSGGFSPLLGRGIGMGYLAPPPAEDVTDLEVGIHERWVPASLAEMPFVRR